MASTQRIGRVLVYNLLDILTTIRACVNNSNHEFHDFMTKHIECLSSLMNASYHCDEKLYSPLYKHMVRSLTDFLKQPETYFTIDYYDLTYGEYYKIKLECRRFRSIEGDQEFHIGGINGGDMNDFFKTYVAKLEHVLANTDYTTLKEEKRELYHDLNKYVLNPERIDRMAHDYGINSIEYLDGIFGMDE